jgi:capsular exopolysaccharide synthesis family protein
MSKIERALRKAEEDKQRKTSAAPPHIEAPPPRPRSAPEMDNREICAPVVALAESFRKIAARLKSCCETMNVNDVLFTSAISQEGKTTTAAYCALSLAQDFNLSVCLVDCDLRNPRLSEFFCSNNGQGIAAALKGKAEIATIIQPTTVPNLSLVHSQRAGRFSLPLLNSERLGSIVYELRSRFDFVLFDAPPILPVADAVVLSKKVSAIALVIEPGRTRRKHLEQILEQVEKTKIVGFIMNYKRYRVPQTYQYEKYYSYEAKPNFQLADRKG